MTMASTARRVTVGAGSGASRVLAVRRYPVKVVVLFALLSAGIIPPFIFLIYSSLHQLDPVGTFGALTLANFAAVFSDHALVTTLINSAFYPLGAALVALAIGATQAWLAERTDAKFRQILYVV